MKILINKGRDGFRWLVKASNGVQVDNSAQGFSRYRACRRNMQINQWPSPPHWMHGAVRAVLAAGKRGFSFE